jgi:hypothetical protein
LLSIHNNPNMTAQSFLPESTYARIACTTTRGGGCGLCDSRTPTIEEAAIWADQYKQTHRNTAPWHYIDLPVRPGRNGGRLTELLRPRQASGRGTIYFKMYYMMDGIFP